MAYYHPCKSCTHAKTGCDKRDQMRASLKGLGVTSVKFKCQQRMPRFKMGQRVRFDWTHYDDDSNEAIMTSFTGTIAYEKRGKLRFVIRVDQEESAEELHPKYVFRNGGDVVAIKPDDIKLLDEPYRHICAECLAYQGETDRCNRSEYFITPVGCLTLEATS